MNFHSLDYFLVLAREKNFTRAAEALHITQQSLSSHIAGLEKELGCTLLVRRTPLELTYAGRTFLRYAESIGRTRQAMEREFCDISENQKGELRVGIAYTRGRAIMPHLIPAEMMGSVEAMRAGTLDPTAAGVDMEMVQTLATATDFGYVFQIFAYLLLYVIGGYLLYSAMFAAVGSAVDNVQDAQQLQTPIMLPIILSIFVMMVVMKDPNSPLVFWCSMIPFTSPVVMMARIPCGIPTWEIVVSLAVLYATFMAMVWLAAKIYRVGIFMYGKKPTFKELYKWIRYKY